MNENAPKIHHPFVAQKVANLIGISEGNVKSFKKLKEEINILNNDIFNLMIEYFKAHQKWFEITETIAHYKKQKMKKEMSNNEINILDNYKAKCYKYRNVKDNKKEILENSLPLPK